MNLACIIVSIVHLLGLAIATYVASIEIETILASGGLCSATGIALAVLALMCKRRWLAAVGLATPILAIILFVLEAFVLHLGPQRASLPFCLVFLVNQVFATVFSLIYLRIQTAPPNTRLTQVTIKTLMLSMIGFSVFLAIAKQLLRIEHNWLMAVSLSLLGLTITGLTLILIGAIVDRREATSTEESLNL